MTTSTDTRGRATMMFSRRTKNLALAGFLAGYSGLTREAYMLDLRQYVAWCAERTCRVVRRVVRTSKRSAITSRRPVELVRRSRVVLHHRLLLPLRGTRRLHRQVSSGACATTQTRLRITRHGPGPQRSRRHARRRRSRRRARSRASQPARTQRATSLRSDRREYRGPRARAGHRTLTILRKGGKTVIIPLAAADRSRDRSRGR